MTLRAAPRHLLICAGLDPSGGAGILADTRIATAQGVRPVGIVTALTVQDTAGVRAQHPLDADVIREQLEALLSDVEVHAVKIGMIGSAAVAVAVGEALHLTGAPVVWDPVLQPSLVDPAYRDASLGSLDDIVRALAPHVRLLTPNARELGLLAKRPVATVVDAVEAAHVLAGQLRLAVLVKAGHLGGDATDILIDGATRIELAGTRIPDGEHVHGTGCALATAIAARLALGDALEAACREAKRIVAAHIANPIRPGRGAPAVV